MSKIKLYTLNTDPTKPRTPRAGALDLTISSPVEQWSLIPPDAYTQVIECATYESIDSMLRALGHRDMSEFFAASKGFRWAARPNLIVDGVMPPSDRTVKLTALMRRKPGMSRANFLAYYPTVHAPLVRKTPELPRYAQNYIIEDDTGRVDVDFVAVAELWWPDRDMAIRSWGSREIQEEQGADTLNFIGPGSVFLFGNERYVK